MRTYTKEKRRNHVGAWKASGLSESAYARGQGIAVTTFCNWVKKDGPEGLGFVELPGNESYQGGQEIIIETGTIKLRPAGEMPERVLGAVFGISGRLV